MKNIRGAIAVPALIGAFGLGAIGPSIILSRAAQSSAPPQSSDTEQRLAALESELDQLGESRYRAAPGFPVHGSTMRDSESEPDADEAEGEDTDATSDNSQGLKSNEELREAYEAVYLRGSERTDWSIQAEKEFSEVIFEKLPPTSSVESFACRSDFCRLEAVHSGVVDNNAFLTNLFSMEREGPLAWKTGGFRSGGVVREPGGGQRQVIFIARPGVRLAIHPDDV